MLGLIRRQPVVIASSWQFIDSRERGNREIAERPVYAFRGPAAAREFPRGPGREESLEAKRGSGKRERLNSLTV